MTFGFRAACLRVVFTVSTTTGSTGASVAVLMPGVFVLTGAGLVFSIGAFVSAGVARCFTATGLAVTDFVGFFATGGGVLTLAFCAAAFPKIGSAFFKTVDLGMTADVLAADIFGCGLGVFIVRVFAATAFVFGAATFGVAVFVAILADCAAWRGAGGGLARFAEAAGLVAVVLGAALRAPALTSVFAVAVLALTDAGVLLAAVLPVVTAAGALFFTGGGALADAVFDAVGFATALTATGFAAVFFAGDPFAVGAALGVGFAVAVVRFVVALTIVVSLYLIAAGLLSVCDFSEA